MNSIQIEESYKISKVKYREFGDDSDYILNEMYKMNKNMSLYNM